jgi:septum formation protein
VPTTVRFRDYSDREIERYLAREQPYDCAGSAKIEGLGIALVERITGDDPSALIGLPLMQLTTMLRNQGVSVIEAAGRSDLPDLPLNANQPGDLRSSQRKS